MEDVTVSENYTLENMSTVNPNILHDGKFAKKLMMFVKILISDSNVNNDYSYHRT